MSLTAWRKDGWLLEHKTSSREVADLLAAADRDLADSQTRALSPDWRFNIAFNAALQSARAALAVSGYRPSRETQHYIVVRSLRLTIGADARTVELFEAFRRKRNIGTYERAGVVSDHEAEAMHRLAVKVRQKVEVWLREHHPEYLTDEPAKRRPK